jgi:hypothetical protein
MVGPGPHHEPPADLRHREPLLLETRQPWFRSYRLIQEPLRLSRSALNRFDDPQMKYGVLYLAEDEHGAFIETFGQSTGITSVTVSALSRRGLVRVEADRALSLMNLADMGGLARVGADGRLCAGDRAIAQRWSRALHDHPAGPDGLYYPARHDLSRRVCALFDHVTPALSAVPLGPWDAPGHRSLLGAILDAYGFALLQD